MSVNNSILLTEQSYQYAPYVPSLEGAPPGYYDNPTSGNGYAPASRNGYAPASGTGYTPASGNGYYNQMTAPSTMYCPPSGQPIAVPPTTTILMTQPYNQMSPNIKVSTHPGESIISDALRKKEEPKRLLLRSRLLVHNSAPLEALTGVQTDPRMRF